MSTAAWRGIARRWRSPHVAGPPRAGASSIRNSTVVCRSARRRCCRGSRRITQFEGPFDDKFKQIGNAVSPRFARALAAHLDAEWTLDHTDPANARGLDHDIDAPIRKSFSSSLASIKRRMRASGHDRQTVLPLT